MRRITLSAGQFLGGIVAVLVAFAALMFPARCQAQFPPGWFEDVRPVPGLNSPWQDQSPFVTDGGLTIYFTSDRPNGGTTRVEHDVWMAARTNTSEAFGMPVNVGVPINSAAAETGLYLSNGGTTLYMASRRPGTAGRSDIWLFERDNTSDVWGNPVSVGPEINTAESEFGPWLSSDGLTLYFSRRQGDDRSTEDIFRATRNSLADDFSNPEKLANSHSHVLESQVSMSSNDLTMFFQRQSSPSSPFEIWVASRSSTSEEFTAQYNINQFVKASSINSSSYYTFTPYISPDWPAVGSKLYFGLATSSNDWDLFEATWVPEPSSVCMSFVAVFGLLGSVRMQLGRRLRH
ncbi:MAG: hypothetical protein R3E01_03375 [Pirellulaceae bacterium]|nr:PD40 domain-containing protein [Planctomycetales bacterium]